MATWYVCKSDKAIKSFQSLVKARAFAYACIKKRVGTSFDISRSPNADDDGMNVVYYDGYGHILCEKQDWEGEVSYIYECRPDGKLGELIEVFD